MRPHECVGERKAREGEKEGEDPQSKEKLVCVTPTFNLYCDS